MTPLNVSRILRLVLVTDDRLLAGRSIVQVCRAAEEGGASAVQLRLKHAMPRDLVQVLRELKRALTIPVLVNDRLDVALAGGADGVHLGPGDVPLDLARMVAPRGFLIGASVGADEEGVLSHDADYWGIGPYHHTGTKSDAGTALEAEGLRRIIAQAPAGKPCIAIGGVEPGDIPEIRMCGAVGAAVVSGILRSADITSATRAYAAAWPE